MTLSASHAFSHAISHTTLPGRGQSNPHFMGCKFKVETFASAFSLHVGAGLELGGILAAEATPLALLLTLWAAHAGWGARQCRVVPPRVTSGTCCRNSDRDKGVQEGLVVDEPCLGGRKGVLACGIQQSRLGAVREPGGEGTKGQRAGLGTQRQQTRAPSFPLGEGGAGSSLVPGGRPSADGGPLFGCLWQACVQGRTVESAGAPDRERRGTPFRLPPSASPASSGPAQVTRIQRSTNSSYFPQQPSHFLE